MNWPIFQGILTAVGLVFAIGFASLLWAYAVLWAERKAGRGWTFVAASALAAILLATATGLSA